MTVHNADVARVFKRLADLLEIEGANPFRVRAYRDAARVVGDLPHDISALVAAGRDLSELHGIGTDLAGKIEEIVETGHLTLLEETERRVPEGLLELLTFGPLGPKRIKTLYDQLGIKNFDDLAAAASSGKIGSYGVSAREWKSDSCMLSSIMRMKNQGCCCRHSRPSPRIWSGTSNERKGPVRLS